MGKRDELRELGRTRQRWEAPDGSVWEIVMQWAELGGRAECVGMELRSFRVDSTGHLRPLPRSSGPLPRSSGPQPVSSEVWRRVPMSIVDETRAHRAGTLDLLADVVAQRSVDGTDGGDLARQLEEKRSAFTRPGARGRKLVDGDGRPLPTDEALATVARIYREAWRAGLHPTRAVAEALSLSRSAAAKRVRRARDAGLLPDTTRGRASAADQTGG